MFRYSNTEQTASEIIKSSIKHSIVALPRCLLSLVVGALYCLMLCIQYKYIIFNKTTFIGITSNVIFDIILISPVLVIYYLQLQAVADNIKYKANELIPIVLNKLTIVILIQFIAFAIVLLAANIFPLIVPFIICPFFIMLPIAIFKTSNIKEILTNSWNYTKSSRLFTFYTAAMFYCVFKVSYLYILYLLKQEDNQLISIPVMLLFFCFSFVFFSAFILNLLHNLMLRHEEKLRQDASIT